MREGWKNVRLADVCTFKPPKKEARQRLNPDDAVSFVPMNNLKVRMKSPELNEERALGKVAGSYTYFADGDVLLAKITPCFENGKLGIAKGLTNGVGFGSSEFIVMRPNEELGAEYLFYFLSQDSVRDAGGRVMSGAVGHKRVPKEFVEGLKLPLPSVMEQKRIVAILDEAFEGIGTVVANTEKNLANVRELFTSYLGKIFDDLKGAAGEVRIDSACDSVIDCINKTAPKVDAPTPFKMIRTTNIRNGFVSLESVKYVTEEVYEKWTRRQVPMSGDVILTREAPMGEVGLLDTEEKVFLGQRLVSYRADRTKLVPEFLLYAFQSPYMQRQIHSFASGSTVQHMRVPDCKKLMLPLPDLDTQWGVVERLKFLRDEVSRVESNYQQKLIALAELKQSLLQKAFSGELTAMEAEAAVEEATA